MGTMQAAYDDQLAVRVSNVATSIQGVVDVLRNIDEQRRLEMVKLALLASNFGRARARERRRF
jgi:hypothetical protein